MRITKRQLRKIIREGLITEGLAGPPQTAEEWIYWGGAFGLSAKEDNQGQTIFYVELGYPDMSRIVGEAEEAYAEVETDNDGNMVIYTGSYNQRDKVMSMIKDKYGMEPKTSEDFGESPGGIWISGEDGTLASDGATLLDYYASPDTSGPYDDFGVHKELSELIGQHGFFAEWYDPGTMMLWRI